MIRLIRYLLFPFSILYTGIVLFRNWAYDKQLIKSTFFPFPVIVIGNLAVGGTGKSPMTEYVLRLMKSELRVAVLSRGYGRRTTGFRYVEIQDTAETVGDEPLQIKRKFPDTIVTVCEDRVSGIQQIEQDVHAVLLDDAYQHRKLRPSFSILLFDYESLQRPVISLPTGNFRELLPASKRANLIVVTKCPAEISVSEKLKLEARLHKYTQVPIFYTKIVYQALQTVEGEFMHRMPLYEVSALVITGIARPEPLLAYLKPKLKNVVHLAYRDHHQFSLEDLNKIKHHFQTINCSKKIIITTEKDIQRLPLSFIKKYPVYIIPIQQEFLFNEGAIFDSIVKRAFYSA